jgi:ADP-heptose:LPS heptosyltransferase
MKRWPADHFARLALELSARGIRTVRFLDPRNATVHGGAWDEDEAVEDDGAIRAGLRPLKALLSRCRAVVTNDSGLCISRLDVPVVALLADGSRLGFWPKARGTASWRRICHAGLRARGRFSASHGQCLKAISPQEVLTAVLGILAKEKTGWK